MSFQNAKIIDYLGDNKFVIQIPEEDLSKDNLPGQDKIQIAHDYVRFIGPCSYQMESKENGKYPYKPKNGACNWVSSRGSITIGIRDMIKIVLPLLNKHKYLQSEHIKDRTHDSDDEYQKENPRYKKGDKYPGYAYDCAIIHFVEDGKSMVSFKKMGDGEYETVSLDLFNQIKQTINWYNLTPKT